MLSGYKTYLAVIAAIAVAIAGFMSGSATLPVTLEAIFVSLGMGGNRWVVAAIEAVQSAAPDLNFDAAKRLWATHGAVAATILTAVTSFMTGHESLFAAALAIVAALKVDFLGLGAKKASTA